MRKIFLAVTLCFVLFFGVKVSAEEIQIDGMQAFREAITSNAGDNGRVFHQDLLFIVPNLQGELEFIGLTENEEFRSYGNLEFWSTDLNGNLSDVTVPFYTKQNGKDMKIYFQTDKKWYQFQSPSFAAVIADMLATPTPDEIEEFISEIKEVNVLRDTQNQRTMLVKLDGNKIAEDMKAEAEKNPAADEDKNKQDKFLEYMDTALRKADVWYMWTIDKRDGKTIMLSFHLSNLVQEVARAALADDSQNWDEITKDLLANVAFYSDVKSYTNFLNPDAKKKIDIPKNVLKAKPVESLVGNKK